MMNESMPVPTRDGDQPMKYQTASMEVLIDQKMIVLAWRGCLSWGRVRARANDDM
eukprot:CAMPEP_0174722124 /NCGR_PEP_ID=MMETSP1094-20130205/37631_1 /TAXON_ID=156173 /ORGANISM="Chrysochromulina brevifilum, Strain UTEX LB 985" /LENGTH=54 /DNA_ID=CAMNT_0015922915 /DNA_START=511 /DNA_END=675 /DNA_ORIENTATION=-